MNETSNQPSADGDFGSVNLDHPNYTTLFTGDCDLCTFQGPHRQTSMQAADDLDEHMGVEHPRPPVPNPIQTDEWGMR